MRTVPVIIYISVIIIFSASLWLMSHDGLSLISIPETGEQYCISSLSIFVGMDPSDWRFQAIHWFSVLWLPIGCVAIIFVLFRGGKYFLKIFKGRQSNKKID